jgi:1-acyl-sn-glycerol-3-phosphate acyltransferase
VPRAAWHRLWWQVPGLREAVTGLGGFAGRPSDDEIREIKSRGEHMIVAPGGATEGLRPFWRNYEVDFGRRRGYLRLAYAHDLPIIPVVSSGVDETYVGLSERYELPAPGARRHTIPAWLGLGLGGMWPFALPFPVKIRQRIGAPIRLRSLGWEADSHESLERAHEHVTTVLQSMLDDLRAEHRPRPCRR